MKKIELLAPAKNIKSIKAGLRNADAFYFAAKKFNMRMQADNFSEKDLSLGVELCHDNNKKAYFVSNILIYENEINSLHQSLDYAFGLGFDAAIVNDLSAIDYCREIGMPFHISTQQNISNSASAMFFEKLGAERIVLARECTLKQITEISKKLKKAKVEAFIHGAMCTMISGRCYFSMDHCGDNSANRGKCLQPCRREWTITDNKTHEYIYDGVRFFNSRDMCMIEYIPEMIDAGIVSFKIEGRMRDPHYVDVVTKIYREAITAYYNGEFSVNSKKKVGKWIFELKKSYNRGFTNGFYFRRPTEFDHQHKSPTNLSHWRLIKMGTITKYSKQNKMATIKLINGSLRNSIEVLIKGDNTSNTYFHQKIRNLEIKGKKVNQTRKATENNPINVSIKIDKQVWSNGADSIYLFTNKTYQHRIDSKNVKTKKDFYKL